MFALIVFLYSVANVLIHQFRSLADKVYITTNNIFRQYFFSFFKKNLNFYFKLIFLCKSLNKMIKYKSIFIFLKKGIYLWMILKKPYL